MSDDWFEQLAGQSALGMAFLKAAHENILTFEYISKTATVCHQTNLSEPTIPGDLCLLQQPLRRISLKHKGRILHGSPLAASRLGCATEHGVTRPRWIAQG